VDEAPRRKFMFPNIKFGHSLFGASLFGLSLFLTEFLEFEMKNHFCNVYIFLTEKDMNIELVHTFLI